MCAFVASINLPSIFLRILNVRLTPPVKDTSARDDFREPVAHWAGEEHGLCVRLGAVARQRVGKKSTEVTVPYCRGK